MRDPRTGRWLPGESGNAGFQFRPSVAPGKPAGRPKGSRKRLLERFIADFYQDWEANGAKVIRKVRSKRPYQYLRAVIAILPKEVRIEHYDEMTDNELEQRIQELAAELGFAISVAEGDAPLLAALPAPEDGQPAQELLPLPEAG